MLVEKEGEKLILHGVIVLLLMEKQEM